ncbi:Signal transduction protein [Coemansia sp. RSA 989]|nr:Signal transduction protein [Coemansia sp. RSA 1086]KAJ1752662.1 Signal transduction protein [Coemansia sp. RSA 1821]KAJ1867814.1 Signal transduction protein [Coemansia sp. RSA 989]KAJ1874697.1 Signal transduction protein [Coemansia sp. RSA 990]KAJ2633696.1 Xenotropic and polytropic retrovirus receptor 1 [Coemansia sp. RSA 1290]KAJ2651324.1 Signal transduction protein [Coemansia sp. RSA 1250]KAJ2673696.1 Signal transduction protein [Coemansia sp. RSA 1085]
MKFGKYLESEQVPEWAKMYVDYDSLKHSVKVIAAAIANHNRQVPAERMSLIRRASSYLGYNSMQTSELPISPNGTHPGQPQCPNAQTGSVAGAAPRQGLRSRMNSCVSQCAEGGGCSHFGSIVSATPQIALTMSAANSGKVAATPVELAHQANIKLPPSAQDAFAGGIRARHTTSSSSCVSAGEFKRNVASRLPEEQAFFQQMEQELVKVNDFFRQKLVLFSTRLDNIKRQQEIYDEMLKSELEEASPQFQLRRLGRLPSYNVKADSNASSSEPSVQLRAARCKIKRAIMELYRGTDLLKNYRIMCYTAFIKALKKYQKTAGWCMGTDYFLNRVDTCYLATSDQLNIMATDLENMYVAKYANGSRSKGMDKLRVTTTHNAGAHQGSVFRSGIMLGLSVPLVVRAIYEANLLSNEERVPYHRQLLQIYGSIFLVLGFLLLFSLNIQAWMRAHINYRFIFEIDPRDYLSAWQFLELSSLFFFIASIVIWVNFALHIDHGSYICIYVLIGVLVGLFLLPVKAVYWSSRWWLIRSLGRVLFSGLFRVEFRDFFLGDELCSLTYTFSMVLMLGCAGANDWTSLDDVCNTTQWWSNAALLMLPNVFRLLQCIRRYYDCGDAFPHLANGAKYTSTILTIWLATTNQIVGGNVWKPIWVASAIFNSCFTSLWDLLMDWGLFEGKSKHRFLRSELKFERTWVYYVAMVMDVTLRFMWIMQISPTFFSFGHNVHRSTLSYIAAALEVVRRFVWNFFRVENEHVSNCGQFRATTDIPLPFHFEEQGSDSESVRNEFEHGYSLPPATAISTPRVLVA